VSTPAATKRTRASWLAASEPRCRVSRWNGRMRKATTGRVCTCSTTGGEAVMSCGVTPSDSRGDDRADSAAPSTRITDPSSQLCVQHLREPFTGQCDLRASYGSCALAIRSRNREWPDAGPNRRHVHLGLRQFQAVLNPNCFVKGGCIL